MIFTDKTGTLTKNKLRLSRFQINGKNYINQTFDRDSTAVKPREEYPDSLMIRGKLREEVNTMNNPSYCTS